jgi:ABC-type Zn2+ transport system substrate-binding protein/surface adhesin
MRITGADEADAVSQLLNLVNELFLVLHEAYPEYLVSHFGLSAE